MGCEFSKLYNLEIHLENELGIFEPLDIVAGHVLIQVENDTSIHHCFLTLRGLAHFSFEQPKPSICNISSNNQNQYSHLPSTNGVHCNDIIDETSSRYMNNNGVIMNPSYECNGLENNNTKTNNKNFNARNHNKEGYNNIGNNYGGNINNAFVMSAGDKDGDGCCERFQIIIMRTEDLLNDYRNKNSDGIDGNDENDPGPEFIITKGLHVFNFEFQLPENLPGSFVVPEVPESEDLRAFIIYNIKVEVVNLVHQVSHSRERDILIFNSMDLTQYPRLTDKVTLGKEFMISECCAWKNRLLCELTVNKCAFVPGEIMKVEVNVKNGSSKPLECVQLSLLQNISTRTCGRSVVNSDADKTVQLRLFSIGMGSVSPRRVHTFTDSIHVPPVVASGLQGCDILDVSYSLMVQLYTLGDKSKRKGLQLKIPITIGTDPIKDASFGDNKEVVPCYALFDYETGSVIEYFPHKLSASTHHMMPVYRYYKPAPINPLLSRCSSGAAISLANQSTNQNRPRSRLSSRKEQSSILQSPEPIGMSQSTSANRISKHQSQKIPRDYSTQISLLHSYNQNTPISTNMNNIESNPESPTTSTISTQHSSPIRHHDYMAHSSSTCDPDHRDYGPVSVKHEESLDIELLQMRGKQHHHSNYHHNNHQQKPFSYPDYLRDTSDNYNTTDDYDGNDTDLSLGRIATTPSIPHNESSPNTPVGCATTNRPIILNNVNKMTNTRTSKNNFNYYLSEESSEIAESIW